MTTSASPRLVGLTVGDRPAAWDALGFEVARDRCTIGGVTIHLVGDDHGRGILAWSLDPPLAVVDGLASRPAPTPVPPAEHRNGVSGVDHVVVATPHVDRTTTALEAAGIGLRRSADGLRNGAATYRFFLLGSCALEVIGPAEFDPARSPRPAAFAGLAFVAADLDDATGLPGVAGEPRDAIQPGRRIVTLRTGDHDVSVPLAVLTPRPEQTVDPTIVFLCVHNAGRSQMAAGWAMALGGESVTVLSGGSEPADRVNPVAVEAMHEVGIDITAATPRRWDDHTLGAADVIVTMGCGDECPYLPGKRYVDWPLDDPAGQGIDAVRPIRDEIEQRVRALLGDLGVPTTEEAARDDHGR